MKPEEKRRVVEALLLGSPEPVSAARLAEILPYCKPGQAKDLVNQLNTEYQEQDRAFEIWEVAGGYQIRTRAEFSGYLQKLQRLRPLRLSRAALETLAIIAYKQPATRGEIEQVRGVESGPVVKSLLDRNLVRVVGQKEVAGRPMLYGTSKRFLEVFGLNRVGDLPNLRELEELAREQGIGIEDEAAEEAVGDQDDAATDAELASDAAAELGASPTAEEADAAEDAGELAASTESEVEVPTQARVQAPADEGELESDQAGDDEPDDESGSSEPTSR
jgi:segregation and condensation protein B